MVGGGGVGCFFFNDTATTEIYTLSLHDALPIYRSVGLHPAQAVRLGRGKRVQVVEADFLDTAATQDPAVKNDRYFAEFAGRHGTRGGEVVRSEEHTSELQSRQYLVCRLLLEKKKKKTTPPPPPHPPPHLLLTSHTTL